MAHIDVRSPWRWQGMPLWHRVLPLCFGLMSYPYTMFVGLLGIVLLGVWQTVRSPKAVGTLLVKSGFLAIAFLMILSASQAIYPGETLLQLTHFLPFFWFWAFLTVYLQRTDNPWWQLYCWAVVLVLASIPLNVIGIVEYIFKFTPTPGLLPYFPLIDWLYLGDLHVPRAFSLFDYPNTLASYLVLMLGLNLGLLHLGQPTCLTAPRRRWVYLLTAMNIPLTLICIFCSGSRNGLLVAIILILVGLLCLRTSRQLKLLGLGGLAFVIATTLKVGIGGRSLAWAWLTDDPRVQVWQMALAMIGDRPLLGYGLGSYKLLYDGEIFGYSYIAHAHNFWLMIASEVGLPAAFLFTLVIGFICFRGYRALQQLRHQSDCHAVLMAYCLAFLGIVLFSLLDITLFEARVNIVTWLSLGVIAASPELSRQCQ